MNEQISQFPEIAPNAAMTTEATSSPIIIVLLLQATAIAILNGLVWFLFLRCRRLRQISNYFLMSLAAAHFAVGVVAVPLYVVAERCEGGSLLIASTSVFYYVLCAEILNMYLVTYERYLAILRPLQYNTRMTQKDVLILICTAWILPLLLMIFDVLFRTLEVIKPFSTAYTTYHWSQSVIFVSIAIALTAINIVMLRTAKRQQRSIRAEQSITSSLPRIGRARRNTKATIFFMYIVGTFFVFWTPRVSIDIYELVKRMSLEHTLTDHVTLAVALLNSVLDPIIYLFFNSDFKSSIRSLRARRRSRVGTVRPRPSVASFFSQGNPARDLELSTTSTSGWKDWEQFKSQIRLSDHRRTDEVGGSSR